MGTCEVSSPICLPLVVFHLDILGYNFAFIDQLVDILIDYQIDIFYVKIETDQLLNGVISLKKCGMHSMEHCCVLTHDAPIISCLIKYIAY